MTFRLAGRARFAIVAVSVLVGTAACGSDDPAAERSVPVIDTTSPDTIASVGTSSTTDPAPTDPTPTEASSDSASSTTAAMVGAAEVGVTEAEVLELEQQLDEIDRVLADLEEQLAQD